MVTGGNIIYFNIVKNGAAVGVMCVEGRGYSLTTVTEFWTVELDVNDEVWIWADTTYSAGQQGAVHGWCNSEFSGFLIGS
ncbi:hypothetical protein DPMN_132948 [Dreissena polymorpha]|uniref:C1q domain-containing protein n=1 Tax=Dreissena polymorpha TaxID=45954 RepID=A0A9D4FT89_DREPO|nr:hypothetical protein DPMN_132883 [Dreissena polymorpha]KAH3804660.1 hypothetical protein DPMN_132948 [Dreissena polymorpha]